MTLGNSVVIYGIRNTANGKVYVGSTKNLVSRLSDHKYALRRGDHHSYRMQGEWKEYGEGYFSVVILDKTKESSRLEREQYFIDTLLSYEEDTGYNISPTAGTTLGRRHREEAKIKMSISHEGKILSEEHRRKQSKALKGYKKSEEHQRKISEALTGRPRVWLREDQVVEIKMMILQGIPSKEIAEVFGVSAATIHGIRAGRTWKHVTLAPESEPESTTKSEAII